MYYCLLNALRIVAMLQTYMNKISTFENTSLTKRQATDCKKTWTKKRKQ